eukprot:gene18667-25185_t
MLLGLSSKRHKPNGPDAQGAHNHLHAHVGAQGSPGPGPRPQFMSCSCSSSAQSRMPILPHQAHSLEAQGLMPIVPGRVAQAVLIMLISSLKLMPSPMPREPTIGSFAHCSSSCPPTALMPRPTSARTELCYNVSLP